MYKIILIIYLLLNLLNNFYKICFLCVKKMLDLSSQKEIKNDIKKNKTNFWTEEEDKILKEKAKEFN